MKEINRSSVNQGQYAAPEFPKSGFDLSHSRYSSYLLGRIHASGFLDVMPGDKISGKNEGNFTFNRIVTPMVAPVDVAQYNMYIPYRALDRTFERAFAPNKNNNMSSGWTAPSFRLDNLASWYLHAFINEDVISATNYGNFIINVLYASDVSTIDGAIENILGSDFSVADFLYNGWTSGDDLYKGVLRSFYDSITEADGVLRRYADRIYMADALLDIKEFVESLLGTSTNPISGDTPIEEFRYNFFRAVWDWSVGRYSYLFELGYNYIRPQDMARMSSLVGFEGGAWSDLFSQIDNTPQNEYALRAMYVIWYEHFRNVDLEPVSDVLPYWRDFGSTSVILSESGSNPLLTVYRIRSWYKDMFTTAQIDDLSRHVYAPVFSGSDMRVAGHERPINNLDTSNSGDSSNVFDAAAKPSIYTLSWLDQLSGELRDIKCPVPANVNDILSSLDTSDTEVYGLDLNSLRQAQMLEKYLKRNYLFGDEYQDRMLAHYNSRVSDLRINRPEILSQSLNGSNMEQEISNVSTEKSNVGDRTATGTLQASGDQYTTYCEEFGIVINILTFMPRASYSGTCPQRLLGKVVDYPLPEFAANNEEFGRIREIADSALRFLTASDRNQDYMFGRYPAYHAWRSRVDEVGGMFLNELQDCTFRRFWGLYSDDTLPKLNYFFIHCRPNLQMFADTIRYNSQIYGDVVHECFVERVLPTPVEVI